MSSSTAQRRANRLGLAAARRVGPPEPAVRPLDSNDAPRDVVARSAPPPADEAPDGVLVADEVIPTPFPPRPLRPDPDQQEAGPAELRPIVHPAWNRENRRATVRAKLRRAGHDVLFHAARAPTVYPLLVASRYPAGLRRAYRGVFTWWMDPRAVQLYDDARAAGDYQVAGHYLDQHDRHVRHRGFVALPALVGVTSAPVCLAAGIANPATRWEALAAALGWTGTLGWFGRPQDRPLLPSASSSNPAARRITGEMLLEALQRAKKNLCPDEDPAVIQAPGVYESGDGWEAVIDLPMGRTAADAMDVRSSIASALRVAESRLEIAPVRGNDSHEGRISVYIAHSDPWTRDPVPSPLMGMRTFSIWDPVPFATNSRGRQVAEHLIWAAWLIGAMPRQGKTQAARILAAAGALDANVELLVANGKGGKDWAPAQEVAYWYGSGVREWVVEGLVKVLREWLEDMRRRYDILERLDDDECPDGKVTPRLVESRHDMRLRMIVIDEAQEYLDDPDHGATIKALLIRMAKLAPATGYIIVLATQKPDSNTIPTALRDQIPHRFCLKTANSDATKTVLGKLMDGVARPEEIPAGREGTGVLLGGVHEPGLVRTHRMNVVEFRKVCQRGRALREAARTLAGHAAGENVDEPIPDRFLEHVLAAFAPEETDTDVWSEVICERLGGGEQSKGDHPELYSGWGPTELANALLRYGIQTKDKGGYLDAERRPVALTGRPRKTRTTRKAVRYADVRQAIDARVKPTPDDPPGLRAV
jgi:S-DNA-T family DNA segregation ATPase FtsK/SpoIIIE